MRRLFIVAALVALCATPVSAAAEPGMSVELGTARLASRIFITVPVTYSCQPMVIADGLEGAFNETWIDVSVQQPQGRRQAYGSAVFWLDGDRMCDGALHAMTLTVRAEPGTAPFKTGRAWISAEGFAGYELWDPETDDWWYVDQSDWTDWIPIRLRR